MSELNTVLIDDNENVVSINAMNSIQIKRFDSCNDSDQELETIGDLLLKNLESLQCKKDKDKNYNLAHELTFNILFEQHKQDLKEYLDHLQSVKVSVTEQFDQRVGSMNLKASIAVKNSI